MHILVINSGSSSIKFSIFDTASGEPLPLFTGEVAGIGTGASTFSFRDATGHSVNNGSKRTGAETTPEAIGQVVQAVSSPGLPPIDAVGYRVVHPGPKLDRHQKITSEVLKDLKEAVEFAPLHDPAAIEVIQDMMARFPNAGHYACFDTVFHQTMPEVATTYAIPARYRDLGVRRYGFHGLSCESIVSQLQAQQAIPFPRRMVIAHLGSGCSVTAVVEGRSVDTTMGLTPTGGVVMGTRPGDLDPGLVLYLLRQMEAGRAAELETMLNRDAGMVALSGLPNDMKTVRREAANGNAQARLAASVFSRSVKKTIGSFAALMGGLDAIVFTGGIGEHDAQSRQEIAGGLELLGISMNSASNEAADDAIRAVSASDSVSAVLVVPAKEDWMIAVHVHRLAQSAGSA